MTWHPPDYEARKLRAEMRVAQRTVENRLADRGLGREQVNTQSFEELGKSLAKINTLLADPSVLDDSDDGPIVSNFPLPISLYLEDRKALILNRLQELAIDDQFKDFEEVLSQSVDDQSQLDRILTALKQTQNAKQAAAKKIKNEVDEVREIRTGELVDREAAVRIYSQMTAIRQSWIARESVASIVGSFLLVVLTATLIFAMFTGTLVIDPISNSYLLILGYFFGTTVSTAARKEGQE